MPDDTVYARNLIGGCWRFPAMPYDYEIRSPHDSAVVTTVPLSSRLDVARAVEEAHAARLGPWTDPQQRRQVLGRVVDQLVSNRLELARLQSLESGLGWADSVRLLDATLQIATSLAAGPAPGPDRRADAAGGVSGHILSWGLPLAEMVTGVLPALAAGDTVVVKPSLRGPLTPVAFAHFATEAAAPPGVVNLVQGTGVDVGAALLDRTDLSWVQVRAGERTLAQAARSRRRTGVPLHLLRAGGNAMVVGAGAVPVEVITRSVRDALRVHSTGGAYGLVRLALHRDADPALLPAVLDALQGTVAAPLPTDALRQRARAAVAGLVGLGGRVLLGAPDLPDDVVHRMGWRLPPTVLDLGRQDAAAARAQQHDPPLGPVLGVTRWEDPATLNAGWDPARAGQGTAVAWGVDPSDTGDLPHGRIVHGEHLMPSDVPTGGLGPAPAWMEVGA